VVTLQQILFAGFVLGADQVTKALVASHLTAGEAVPLGPWLRIRLTVTRFRSYGLMHSRTVLLLLWCAVLTGVVFGAHSGYLFQQKAAQMALCAAMAGAASNLYDRLRRGAVVDFLELGWWPSFNLADVAITLGVVVAIWFN
jgi:signal peptidase II